MTVYFTHISNAGRNNRLSGPVPFQSSVSPCTLKMIEMLCMKTSVSWILEALQ